MRFASVSSPARRFTTRLVATSVVCAAGIAGLSASPAMAGSVKVVGPDTDLSKAMAALHAGDTLQIKPGTYNQWVRPLTVNPGTASAPITITAQDSKNPPQIVGAFTLVNAKYWNISRLKIRGTQAGRSPLELWGGSNWSVTGNDISGAATTKSYANVVIANSNGTTGTPPSGFRFSSNCVHDAANAHLNADHNIYVSFHGTKNATGTIERNLVFNHNNGAGIKLGDGGAANAPGPWGVKVQYNTIGNGGRQILLHGNVGNNLLAGNLLAVSKTKFNNDPRTTAIYVHDVTGTGNVFVHNYGFASSMISYDLKGKLRNAGDNGIRPDAGARNVYSCGGWQTTNPKAAAYGRYATGAYPRW